MLKIKKISEKIETFFLDTLLPKHCLSCNQEGTFLCSDCLKLIKLNSFQVCPICQKSLTKSGEVCRVCRSQKPFLDGLTTAVSYQDPLVAKLVKALKYKFIDQLNQPLAEILRKACEKNKVPLPDIIIPVPLHPLRLRWRGFNQSEILARTLSQKILPGLPIKVDTQTLFRTKYTATQASLKKGIGRQKNIKGVFQINPEKINDIKNKRILLIDDICTTGSTLFECGKQLRQLKPKSIQALVIARQN